jgi:hypothetical protein
MVSFSSGLPCPQGLYFQHQELSIGRSDNLVVSTALKPTAFWPDNSIKWLFIDGETSSKNLNDCDFSLIHRKTRTHAKSPLALACEVEQKQLGISLESMSLWVDAENPLVGTVTIGDLKLPFAWQLDVSGKFQPFTSKLVKWHYETSYFSEHKQTPDRLSINFNYQLVSADPNLAPIEFNTEFVIFCHHRHIQVKSTLTNPNPAQHDNGTWDLGDINSCLINAFAFNIRGITGSAHIISIPSEAPHEVKHQGEIWQQSSAGKHSQSPIHVNAKRQLPDAVLGADFQIDDTRQVYPQRAEPSVFITGTDDRLVLTPEKFWQNFPTSLAVKEHTLSWSLFKALPNDPIELQPGEQKTHRFSITLQGKDGHDFTSPIAPAMVVLNPSWVEHCQLVPWFSTKQLHDPLQAMINKGIQGPDSFFNKRENIDEYGWRHFGELYADHETSGYTGEALFVSHYNNQYDPLYGFLRQWLLTGNSQWFELAQDLARHVIDIDIYHTDLDKPEYNHGLFWHTDHYLPAETATHRTYSKHHTSNAYQDHAGGGGPGGQHCYTSGLALYYQLTGCLQAKKAVVDLADWISHVYDGDNTLFSLLLAVKNRHRKDLKNIITGTYPLDRGTANYMVALLDAYDVTGEQHLLAKVGHIIHYTVSPQDRIQDRHLDNVEECWFYTVFLQAVCRFIEVKNQQGEDADKHYAIACLLHYADWMAEHEYNYLEKPEILEYPNQTWTAQDLRKVAVLSFAATLTSPQKAHNYATKAAAIKSYIVKALEPHEESSYTRILALLMQNYGVDTSLSSQPGKSYSQRQGDTLSHRDSGWKMALQASVQHFSIPREWRQLKKRIPALRKY